MDLAWTEREVAPTFDSHLVSGAATSSSATNVKTENNQQGEKQRLWRWPLLGNYGRQTDIQIRQDWVIGKFQ